MEGRDSNTFCNFDIVGFVYCKVSESIDVLHISKYRLNGISDLTSMEKYMVGSEDFWDPLISFCTFSKAQLQLLKVD